MRKCLLLILALVVTTGMVLAQERTVSGKVTSTTDGSSLPGVNVVVKGTTSGAVTDTDGNYKLTVPTEGGTLVFSFIGLKTQEVEIGSRSVIDVQMAEDVATLSEVVVTGLGVKREKKALGYGVTSVSSDEIQNRPDPDIAHLLRGKAPGVAINQTSGLTGAGSNVIIRGYSSITGTNQPLYIIDGNPINTDTNTGNQSFTSGSATASSRFADIDPSTIVDINILKGLAATNVYGERGRNGVILITTKNGQSGNANKKMEIGFTQGITISQVASLPDYQNTFGNGFNAGFGWFFSNWGAAFSDLRPSSYGSDFKGLAPDGKHVLITHPYDQAQYNDDLPQYIGADYVYKPYKSVENFFQSGLTSNSSLSVRSALGDNGTISATYSFLTDEGFTPKLDELRGGGRSNFVDKHNFGLGIQNKLQNGIKIRNNFNFVNSDRLTPITAPAFGGDGNGLFAAIMFTPRSMDLMGLPYQSPIDGSNVYYRRGSPIQNPRWTLNNTGQTEKLRRFFSSSELSYDLTDNITLLYRFGLDTYQQINERHINRGGARVPDGLLSTFNIRNNQLDHVVNVLYNFQLSEAFNLTGMVGFESIRETHDETWTISTNQFVYDLNVHNNFIEHDAVSFSREENTMGVFANASLSYNSYLFLTGSVRNDWTSTLEKANNSKIYPSVSLSFIPTDAFEGLSYSNAVNYLKLRVGYGTSAGYPDPYKTRSVLNASTNVFVSKGGTILNTNSVSDILGNKNLKPELQKEYEGGVEGKFFNSMIGIDVSLYHRTSSDLLVDLPLDAATGFTRTTVNGAEIVNKGIEASLNVTPPIPGEIQWDLTFNFTKNVSDVNSISNGIERVQVSGGGYGNLGNYAIPGQPYGVLFGESFLKNSDGKFVVDSQGNYQASGNFGVIGDPNPDYTLTWINTLSWKGLTLGFQWDYTKGGDIFSSTVQALLARGNTVDTDVDRNVPIIMPNAVKQTGTGSNGEPIYAPNDIQTYIGDSFFRAYFFADEGGVFDATVIRLREVSLSYDLPKKLLEKTPFGRASLTVNGQNLWFNAPNFPKGINFDPELSSVGVGNGRGFDFRTAPSAKKYGFVLSVTF